MKRTNTTLIKDLLNEWMRENQVEDKLCESRIITSWPKVLGPLAKSTRNLYIKNKVLFVSLSSSVVRNELYMHKSQIIQALNDQAGKETITDIVFR